jgi:hypothetical protein
MKSPFDSTYLIWYRLAFGIFLESVTVDMLFNFLDLTGNPHKDLKS